MRLPRRADVGLTIFAAGTPTGVSKFGFRTFSERRRGDIKGLGKGCVGYMFMRAEVGAGVARFYGIYRIVSLSYRK